MLYRAIGLMSGSSLDGLDIAFAEFQETGGQWSSDIKAAVCYGYEEIWKEKLQSAAKMSALDYQLLHVEFGYYLGMQVNRFLDEFDLHFKVALISSHGHTVFHNPSKKMTAQLGDGASIAAETGLPVVSDLRSLDIAFGGQGAPIVPIGEKLLMPGYDLFLNLGGIANISFSGDRYIAFDVCPANRVLNLLANEQGEEFDESGELASSGSINPNLLEKLNALDYYKKPFPKSLANEFGVDVVFPIIKNAGCTTEDGLRTYVEHIVSQIHAAVQSQGGNGKMLVTGGGAFNEFLIRRLTEELKNINVEVSLPDEKLIKFKEALVMAFIGVLRWRQEYNVLASVTGASRNSIGGALWTGQEA
jgi:anhydro-N-acetylmuramic acid kinase